MRIATWNVNSLGARLERVLEWLELASPDVVCLQETKLADAAFPAMAFTTAGYEAAHHGQGRWNGVAILSRVGLSDVTPGFADGEAPDEEARLITATCDGVRVSSVYVPNGRSLDSEHYRYKLAWLRRLLAHLATTSRSDADVVVAGDFNIAPDDRDVWDPAAFAGATHTSDPERAALGALLEWGLVDVFRQRYHDGGLYSWWDYRAGDFHNRRGLRIDLILASEPLARREAFSLIDRNARKGQKPSDHAPVLADFNPAPS